jgi:hypothetical protein
MFLNYIPFVFATIGVTAALFAPFLQGFGVGVWWSWALGIALGVAIVALLEYCGRPRPPA